MNRSPIRLTLTNVLIALMLLGFLVAWLPSMAPVVIDSLAWTGSFAKFWTLITYPFAAATGTFGLLFLVIACLSLYTMGNALEAGSGTKVFSLEYSLGTVLGALFAYLGAILSNQALIVAGPWLPVSALTCLWAARNPTSTVCMMGVSISTKTLAIVTCVLTVIFLGAGAPLVGIFAAIPSALAWFYGQGRFARKQKRVVTGRGPAKTSEEFDRFVDNVRTREKERKEQERLRRLLEGSSQETKEPPE